MAEKHATDNGLKQPPAPEALKLLKAGNIRYTAARYTDYDLAKQRMVTNDGQYPFAAIVSCMDSRTSAELVFDLGLGDIFSIRNAGNVVTDAALGSLEYATAAVGVKLIVVLGHTSCGAVKGACDNLNKPKDLPYLTKLLKALQPAKDAAKNVKEPHNSGNHAYVEQVTNEHVILGARSIVVKSNTISNLVNSGAVGICPAVYDISTGEVTFFEEHATFGGKTVTKADAAARSKK